MALLDHRHARLYGAGFSLWDVRDVEAHVRALLDSWLREHNARLDAKKYDDALQFLVTTCWRISGLQGDGRTPRTVHAAYVTVSAYELTWTQRLGPFKTAAEAADAGQQWRQSHTQPNRTVAIAAAAERPPGTYDPGFGLAFSTFSRRILEKRVTDWYRQAFHDTRYGDGVQELSLESLAADHAAGDDGDEGWLDRNGPGGRLDFVDELNRHVYTDQVEEALTRAAVAV